MFERFSKRQFGFTVVAVGTIAVLILAPLLQLNVLLSLQLAFVYALFATATNLLLGTTGILSFGQGLYLGLAAYVIAIGWRSSDLPFGVLVLLAIVGPTLLSVVLGAIALRARKFYFGILTLAFTQLFFVLSRQFYDLTGGDTGIFGSMVPEWLSAPRVSFTVTFVAVVLSTLVLWLVTNSPYGKSLKAIRENRQRAQALGINVYGHELVAFVIAGLFTSIAGVLFALSQNAAYPGLLEWNASGVPLFMVLIGGMHYFFGPMVGAFIFHYGRELLVTYADYWQIYFGALILAVVLFAPGGVMGLANKTYHWLRRKQTARRSRHRGSEAGSTAPAEGKGQ